MTLFKVNVFVACYATSLSAATITSGTITLDTQLRGTFSLNLSDSVSFGGYAGTNDSFFTPGMCRLAFDPPPCMIIGGPSAGFNKDGGFGNPLISGYVLINVGQPFAITLGFATQSITLPFTASGTLAGPYYGDPRDSTIPLPCPFPGVPQFPYCSEQISGSGYVTLTVDRYYPGTSFELYQLDQQLLTFTPQAATPEPKTWILISLSVAFSLLTLSTKHVRTVASDHSAIGG